MSSTDRILQMVTEKNHPTYPLTPARVALSNLMVENASDHNTRVTMRARGAGSNYTGEVALFYTRVSLSALGDVYAWQEEPFSITALLSAINVAKKAQMTGEDVTNLDVPASRPGEPLSFTLSAQDASLVWLGNTRVNVLTGIPLTAPELFTFLDKEAAQLFKQAP